MDCAAWPADEQAAWLALFDPERPDRLSLWARRKESPWVRETQYNCASVYSRYLDCVRRHGLPDAVTPEGLHEFIKEAEGRDSTAWTVAGYVKALRSVMELVHPDRKEAFLWLKDVYAHIEAVAKRQPKKKSINLRRYSSVDLYRLGVQEMLEALKRSKRDWRSIQMMRDGLWLLLGCCCPERLKALESIRICDVDLERGRIDFPAHKVKTKEENERVIPETVRAVISAWIEQFRAHYEPDHDYLFIARGGGPVQKGTMYAAMRKLTQEKLGVAVTPHRFRDAAATFVVQELPELAALTRVILNHASWATTRNYRTTAKQLVASRRVADHLESAERALERQVRKQHRRSPRGRASCTTKKKPVKGASGPLRGKAVERANR
jgi:integrase